MKTGSWVGVSDVWAGWVLPYGRDVGAWTTRAGRDRTGSLTPRSALLLERWRHKDVSCF